MRASQQKAVSPLSPSFAPALLRWFDRHKRDLPWRRDKDPYRIWLSEMMLQQTTVATVMGYYNRFLARFPTVQDVAAASLDEVLTLWQGLGYYARARNLHRAAQQIVHDHEGRFPRTVDGLKTLAGVGTYTAAAIAAIAFGGRATVVDGNVERVMARLFAVRDPVSVMRRSLHDLAGRLTPAARCGDYAEALMDLGATVCTPKNPKCGDCPVARYCRARADNVVDEIPRRVSAPARPEKRALVFWCENARGQVFVRQRPPTGLLGGLWEFPTSAWEGAADFSAAHELKKRTLNGTRNTIHGSVRHTFSHFHLTLDLVTLTAARVRPEWEWGKGKWVARDDLHGLALPTLMRKVEKLALKN